MADQDTMQDPTTMYDQTPGEQYLQGAGTDQEMADPRHSDVITL